MMGSTDGAPSSRRTWQLLVCVVITLVAVGHVVSKVEWGDAILVDGERIAGRVTTEADVARFVGDDGNRYELAAGSTYLPGFATLLGRVNPLWLIVGLAGSCTALLLMAVRWRVLLRSHGLDPGFRDLLRLVWLGSFANNFFPGTSGNDVAMVVCICRRTPGSRAAAASTVLVGRVLGLVSLLLIGIVAHLLSGGDDPDLATAMQTAVSCVVATFVGGGLLLSTRLRGLLRVEQLYARLPFGSGLRKIDETILAYRTRLGTLAAGLGLSLLMQGSVVACVCALSQAIGLEVSVLNVCVAVPFAILVGALSPSINGVGVREAAFQVLFAGVLAPSSAIALSLLFRGVELLSSLPGCLPMLAELQARRSLADGSDTSIDDGDESGVIAGRISPEAATDCRRAA